MQKFILSLDQGTTSSRVILYNTNFKCSSDYDLYFRLIKNKYKGTVTNKNDIIGNVASGGYSSSVSFFKHILEEAKIRIHNKRAEHWTVTLVDTGIYNDSGLMVGKVIFGESRLAAGRASLATTTFRNATEEQVMTYQFVWAFRMHTGETIVCTFSITNPKSCLRSLID